MNEVDAYIPEPTRETDKDYLMPVEDVFSISGRGTVVTGAISQGRVNLGDEIEIVGLKDTVKTTVTGIEMFRKEMDYAEAGDNAGILLRGIKKKKTFKEDKFLLSQVQLLHILNSEVKYISFLKRKVVDTLHSSQDTDHNFM